MLVSLGSTSFTILFDDFAVPSTYSTYSLIGSVIIPPFTLFVMSSSMSSIIFCNVSPVSPASLNLLSESMLFINFLPSEFKSIPTAKILVPFCFI